MKTSIKILQITTEYEKQVAALHTAIREKEAEIECKDTYISELIQQIEELKGIAAKTASEQAVLNQKIEQLTNLLIQANKRIFGQSSDKTEYVSGCSQTNLFNESEKEGDRTQPEPAFEEVVIPQHTVKKHKKQKGYRKETLEGLDVEVVEHVLNPEDRICPECDGDTHVIARVVERREVEIIPAKVCVVEHVREVYGCRRCEIQGVTAPIIKAPMPAAIIPNSIATPAAVAFVMYQKYDLMIPLARQEMELACIGLRLSRQVMANWVIICAQRYLRPVYDALHIVLASHTFLHSDDTYLQVLKEEGRKPTSDSHMWVYRTAERDGPPIILFEYSPTRKAEYPRQFLIGFKGYINCDGYAGYDSISEDVIVQGCFSHCRKYFKLAVEAIPKDKRAGSDPAIGLGFCNKLFDIERGITDNTDDERFEVRLKDSKPVLEAFFAWLEVKKCDIIPKSPFGKAITYALNQWPRLTRFLDDGRLEIHNNLAERSIRPFTLARKNFMFCDTVAGAEASEVVFSIIQTGKANGLNPYEYLKFLLEKMITAPYNSNSDQLVDLLPWSDSIPASCKFKK